MLPYTKLGRRDSNTLALGLHPTPYCEDVTIGHSRRRHTCSRVNCVLVSLDKFQQKVYIAVGILVRKKIEKSITDRPVSTFYDRTFHIRFEIECPFNVACPENVYLEILAPVFTYPHKAARIIFLK